MPDAYARVRASVALLKEFPRAGVPLEEKLFGLRSILGPWSWMRIIYAYDERSVRVDVLTFLDTREG